MSVDREDTVKVRTFALAHFAFWTIVSLLIFPQQAQPQLKFKPVAVEANPPTDLEYHVATTYQATSAQGRPINNTYLTTKVTIGNLSQAAGKKLMVCLEGASTKLEDQSTVSVRDVNIRYFGANTPNQFRCLISPRNPKPLSSRYGNVGCRLVELDKLGSPEDTQEVAFVTGSIPNQVLVPNDRSFPIQDGIPRIGGDSSNGNGHRTQVLLGARKAMPLADGLRDLRLYFIVFGDQDTDMGCRQQFANIGTNMPYVPPCKNPVPPDSACNQCFGMNFRFNLPSLRPNFKIYPEFTKYNAIPVPGNQGAQLQVPFGIQVARGDDDPPAAFSAYLRVIPPPGLPPESFSVFPSPDTYFTVVPGSDQEGVLTLNLPTSLPTNFFGDFFITIRKADNTDVPPGQRDIQSDEILVENWIPLRSPVECDVNSDGSVDVNDVNEILAFAGISVTPPHRYDVDGDGKVTVADARICATKCTNPNCQP
jgi:hypothetical protein